MPTADEFNILEELVSVLSPVKQATELLSGSKYATVSCMVPVLQQLLLNSLEIENSPALKSIKQTVALDLSARYQEPELKKILLGHH